MQTEPVDLFVIGGGVNGCGIARDAAGRGLSVTLAEQGDLAQATSSASSKLFHGGLRYLEYYEFRLVREALKEREVLIRAMPHISWPMRFVLPHHRGLRPRWLLRLGLFLYDHLGGRKILPPTRAVDFTTDPTGAPLKDIYRTGFEYSDGWVQDSRLVVLNARDAADRGAEIVTRTRVTSARRGDDVWTITLEDVETGKLSERTARNLVNAGGPWVAQILNGTIGMDTEEKIRLVRGSHIVTRKLFDHDQPYILQGADGRIVFAIPYEQDFTLIGTTDVDHDADMDSVHCSDEEAAYLCDFVSDYFRTAVTPDDIVWRYSGVRPLYDDGASSATAATRDYVLSLNTDGAPLLNVFGGKITTYRKLAQAAVNKFCPSGAWTAGVPLPGGDFPWDGAAPLTDGLLRDYPFLDRAHAGRLVRTYGTCARQWLGAAQSAADLGHDFGATLTEAELRWLRDREFALTGDDVLWRRTKLGLLMNEEQKTAVDAWMRQNTRGSA
ncbi:glycerol-3-phosphate dehydrogenase [Shimia biformata]|uniref:glycerol-3-phosphate dehydrogenase n=1 Tax=Shimia biformata TaxID=1294299 RepID=UPI001950FAA2|nr:glycerol-3-phosphate dehydrogenase [Shimia biformata]